MAQPTSRPTSTPTKGPVTATAQTGLVVYYDSVSLTLLNNTKTSVNLTSVNFKYGEKYLGAARWGKVVAVPINAFPAGQCLQILGVAEALIKPEVCSFVRSIMQFPPDRLFWTQDDFDVLNGDKVLVTCKKGAGRCAFPGLDSLIEWTNLSRLAQSTGLCRRRGWPPAGSKTSSEHVVRPVLTQ